ncbi:MAG TPA: vWA domain-containing protein [Methyloceanibacter sp.]|nr:vWA domain-containing protein [Methyloceanibacter sp.]
MGSALSAIRLAALVMFAGLSGIPAVAEDTERTPCNEDAMLVFDASGSMAGTDRLGVSTPIPITRIDKLRSALAKVLPSATRFRRVGLITYGPGPYQQCNVQLNFAPMANAAETVMHEVNSLVPAGKTPLTAAVDQAAEVLKFREKPGVIVVVTDGEETCGGAPCDLGKILHTGAMQLTVHVIGYRVKDFSWMGEQSIGEVKCLADQNGGLYITAESEQDLVEALEKTLGCPMLSQRTLP